jgi:hypothetical protein
VAEAELKFGNIGRRKFETRGVPAAIAHCPRVFFAFFNDIEAKTDATRTRDEIDGPKLLA